VSAADSVFVNSEQSVFVGAEEGVIVGIALCKSVGGVSREGVILVASLAIAKGATVGEQLMKKARGR
jgi:hypothetical protein